MKRKPRKIIRQGMLGGVNVAPMEISVDWWMDPKFMTLRPEERDLLMWIIYWTHADPDGPTLIDEDGWCRLTMRTRGEWRRQFAAVMGSGLVNIDDSKGTSWKIRPEPWWNEGGTQTHWNKSAYPEVYERDGHACRYCGSKDRLSIDHLIPRSRDGSDDASNLVVACKTCNSKKHARTPEEAGMSLRPLLKSVP